MHKYLGPADPETPTPDQPKYDILKETNIQDLLFLENRDRIYDENIYIIRGVYTVQDNDFDLSQFGIFLSNDILFLTVHINSSVKTVGRKIMSGDVLELPHLKDEYALNDLQIALKRFYVVEEISRAAEGFSQTWYPHLYRLKLKQIVDSQEFKDILDLPADEDSDLTLRDLLSTDTIAEEINQNILEQAELDSPKSGYNTKHFYTIALNEQGFLDLINVDEADLDGTTRAQIYDKILNTPDRDGYNAYLVGEEYTPNGHPFGMGISFPGNSLEGDYFLRTDFAPKRLFRFNGITWKKVHDVRRETLSNTDDRNTLLGGFVNNTNKNRINGELIEERQSLSKALKPKADL